MKQWFYTHDGQQQGPIQEADLVAMFTSGQLQTADVLVWTEGMSNWVPARDIKNLIPATMKTAEEMYQYCKDNKYRVETSCKKHFKVIERMLSSDEVVLTCFAGMHNNNCYHYAYAVTDKRIIFARKKIFGENLKTVFLDQLNDIGYSSGISLGTLTIDTLKETFCVMLGKKEGEIINDKIQTVLRDIQNKFKNIEQIDSSEEIRKFKKLFDENIISEEEFEKKKKKLLGI